MNNKLSCSYGLVVKTASGRTVLLHRKVPYCIQDFFHYLHKRKIPYTPDFSTVQGFFKENYAHRLAPHEISDYQRYLNNEIFEDLYDFPHGQLSLSSKRQKNITLQSLFQAAYREFREETGFHFDTKNLVIENLPLICIGFKGCDGNLYEQYYFIVDNVKDLRRHSFFNSFKFSRTAEKQITSWSDDRLIYHGKIMTMQVAFEKLIKQQHIKSDLKYLLCLPTNEILRLLVNEKDSINQNQAQLQMSNLNQSR